jgi:endonuclease YncB( thermonuclease family)
VRWGFPGTLGLILLIFCVNGGTLLWADTIVLNNGARIENVETWKDGGQVKCRRFGSVVGYPNASVLMVIPGPVVVLPESRRSADVHEERPASRAAPLPAGLAAKGFRMKHAFDGDSLKATDGNLTVHIRIIGIDAPERGSRKNRTPGQPYSRKATDYLKRLLSKRTIRIKGYGIDSYNRQLAEIFVGGRNVGLEMVEAGYAEVYTGRLQRGFDPRPYVAAEARARKFGRGIWAQGRMYLSPRKWRATHPR